MGRSSFEAKCPKCDDDVVFYFYSDADFEDEQCEGCGAKLRAQREYTVGFRPSPTDERISFLRLRVQSAEQESERVMKESEARINRANAELSAAVQELKDFERGLNDGKEE